MRYSIKLAQLRKNQAAEKKGSLSYGSGLLVDI